MNRLLKELENLKGEKTPKEGKESSSREATPARTDPPVLL